ncbi:MAG: hypothetical protein WAO08_14865, partial [Hyphomicrobiaceae bacterium]
FETHIYTGDVFFHAGDVGYVPFARGHYIENTDTVWLALTPPELVKAHLELDQQVMDALRKQKAPVVPA